MAGFNIRVRTGGSRHPGGEPSDFVSAYLGTITCTDDEAAGAGWR